MTNIKTKKTKIVNIIYISMLLIGIILLISLPQLSINSFFVGIRIWATKVLPALLPFFILSKLLSFTNFATSLGKYLSPFTQKMYGVGGISGYVYIMSAISGYPVGAKLTSDLVKNNKITSGQAQIITSFTSTSGPLFIIGTVAIGFYNNQIIGVVIIISHMLGALLNGLLYRKKANANNQKYYCQTISNPLNESMTSSILSIMTVGGFISLFYMFLQIFLQLNIFKPVINLFSLLNISPLTTKGIISGFIEVTTGCLYLAQTTLTPAMLAIISTFLISFGGLSIHAQAYTFLHDFGMSYKTFLFQKTTHAIISTILAIIIVAIIF